MTLRFLVILFFYSTISYSQEITGTVYSIVAGEPLEGASVYFNNTTIGTTTNSKGEFTLEFPETIDTPLIISFLGYQTLIIDDFSEMQDIEFVLLESANFLNEVVLSGKDSWSRELKLKEFKRNYLGETKNGLSSSIKNEKDLILRYDKKKKKLSAYSNVPILIHNKNLEYDIRVNLIHFEVVYSYVSMNKKNLTVKNVYYLGNNFFQSIEKNPSKSILKKRMDSYYGSPLHFIRSLARENLEKEKYKLFAGGWQTKSKRYITVTPIDNLGNVKVEIKKDKLNIVFKGNKQSYIKINQPEFYIDNFGNHAPPKAISFGGDLGTHRMGDALPLNFLILKE